jgi:hypothetical protein
MPIIWDMLEREKGRVGTEHLWQFISIPIVVGEVTNTKIKGHSPERTRYFGHKSHPGNGLAV